MTEDRPNPSREYLAQPSHTAQDFLDEQLRLEADAREALPWSFDHCSKPLGPLKQSIFSCLTCNPPPSDGKELEGYIPAGICYSCSISCHGDHQLAELFTKRDFECDCGTTRIQSSTPCTLRPHPETGLKGDVRNETPRKENRYNQNFRNRFCGCGGIYDPEAEKGIMFQCLGLGACGEDWWHPECLLGIPRAVAVERKNEAAGSGQETANDTTTEPTGDDANEDDDEAPLPDGFPGEDDFEALICYRCVDANPWLKAYAGTPGFLSAVHKKDATTTPAELSSDRKDEAATPARSSDSNKRKHDDEADDNTETNLSTKRVKQDEKPEKPSTSPISQHASPPRLHESLPPNPPTGTFSLFLKEDFRDHLCHCPSCFPNLSPYPQLLAEEEIYQPPSDSRSPSPNPSSLPQNGGTGSVHSGGRNSLYERGEAALNTMDRVKALEGVMIYQHLRDKVKEFLRPYAETGEAVGAEDVREYFARLRGDDQGRGSGAAAGSNSGAGDDTEQGEGDNRKEQSGY